MLTGKFQTILEYINPIQAHISFTPNSLQGGLVKKIYNNRHIFVKTFDILQKSTMLKNYNYFLQKQLFKQNCAKTKKCVNLDKVYIFEKLLTQQIQMCKNICKISKN